MKTFNEFIKRMGVKNIYKRYIFVNENKFYFTDTKRIIEVLNNDIDINVSSIEVVFSADININKIIKNEYFIQKGICGKSSVLNYIKQYTKRMFRYDDINSAKFWSFFYNKCGRHRAYETIMQNNISISECKTIIKIGCTLYIGYSPNIKKIDFNIYEYLI